MNEQIRNVDPLEYMNSKIMANSKFYSKIRIRAVLFRENNSTYLCLADVNFLYKNETIPKDILHDYGGVILAEYTIDLKDWKSFVKEIQSENIKIMDITNVKISGGFNREPYHISSRTKFAGVYNEWPFWYLLYSAKQDVHYMGLYDQIASPGKPAYSNFLEAMRSFLKSEDNYNVNTPIGIYLKVPDYRARIKTLEMAENQITVYVETRESRLEDLIVQLYCKKGNIDFHPESDLTLDSKGIARISLPFVPDYVDTFLLEKKSGDKIDSKIYPFWFTDESIVIKTSKERVEAMLAGRENQHVEFKASLDNKNQSEFIETVSAFANTSDGTILLGVSNDNRVIGFYDDFEKTEKRIKGMINSWLEPTIEVNIETLTIDNKPIIAIRVKEGTDKPYLVDGRTAFKRVKDDDIAFKRIDFDNIYRPKFSQQPRTSVF
jgi:hypothetical protein